MPKFTVTIEETVVQDFEIAANSLEEALEKACKGYQDGNIIVENGECQYAQARATDGISYTDWKEI